MRVTTVLIASLLVSNAYGRDNKWFMEYGPWYRGGLELEIQGGSIPINERDFLFSDGAMVRVPGGSILNDNTSEAKYRSFENGFVGPSGWPISRQDGETQYWGYQSGTQWDQTADRINYTLTLRDSGRAVRREAHLASERTAWQQHARTDGVGAFIAVGRNLVQKPSFAVSGVFQIGWLQEIKWSGAQRVDDRVTVAVTTYESAYERTERWNYSYDTFGNPFIPDAPYAMSDPSALGPFISDTPISVQQIGKAQVAYSERIVGSDHRVASSDIVYNVDAVAVAMNLGPRVQWFPSARWGVLLQAGVTLNMLDAKAQRREIVTDASGQVLQSRLTRDEEIKLLPGASVTAGVQFDLADDIYISLSGSYDYVDAHDFTVGPDRLEVDISGYRVDAALGIRFGSSR